MSRDELVSADSPQIERAEYDDAAVAVPEFTVLNDDYSAEEETSDIDPREPEFYGLPLHTRVADASLTGRDVSDVSSGRARSTQRMESDCE